MFYTTNAGGEKPLKLVPPFGHVSSAEHSWVRDDLPNDSTLNICDLRSGYEASPQFWFAMVGGNRCAEYHLEVSTWDGSGDECTELQHPEGLTYGQAEVQTIELFKPMLGSCSDTDYSDYKDYKIYIGEDEAASNLVRDIFVLILCW